MSKYVIGFASQYEGIENKNYINDHLSLAKQGTQVKVQKWSLI